ncbi:MAG: cyclase family protein [Steroidobacteraceae bacterium]
MSVRKNFAAVAVGIILAAASLPASSAAPSAASLEQAFAILKGAEFIDLTHAFGPETPHWKGFAPETVTTLFTIANDGFHAERFCHPGQWGTHVDPPAHFHDGLKTVDQIDPKEFLLRLVVLDVHEKVAKDSDYVVTLDDVKGWELRHGAIPAGAFVALRTDWSKRWPNDAAMQNADDQAVAHYPGWSKSVLHYLYEQRKITASGHETTDTDPGVAVTKDDYSLESYILGTNHFQIELLANLDQVPEAGALVLVTFPKPENGSGFPARVIAVVPKR